jgi:hypothetical protein
VAPAGGSPLTLRRTTVAFGDPEIAHVSALTAFFRQMRRLQGAKCEEIALSKPRFRCDRFETVDCGPGDRIFAAIPFG